MRKSVVLGLGLATFMVGVAYAAEAVAEAAGAPPKLFTGDFWKLVGTGIVSGFIASLVGLLKSGNLKDFDFQRAINVLVIGAVIGAVAAYKGVQFADAEAWLATLPVWAGLSALIEMAIKAIYRKVFPDKATPPVEPPVTPADPQ